MSFFKIAAIIVLGVSSAVILGFSVYSRHPIRTLFMNMLIGIAAFAAVDLTSRFTGVHIPVNEWTVSAGSVFGIPALCFFVLASNFIFC